LIETLALTLFRNRQCATLENGLLMFFEFLASFSQAGALSWPTHYGISIGLLGGMSAPDLAGTGTNVASGIDAARLAKLFEHAARSRNWMLEAQRATSQATAIGRVARALRVDS
jgi:hypothetical protein